MQTINYLFSGYLSLGNRVVTCMHPPYTCQFTAEKPVPSSYYITNIRVNKLHLIQHCGNFKTIRIENTNANDDTLKNLPQSCIHVSTRYRSDITDRSLKYLSRLRTLNVPWSKIIGHGLIHMVNFQI